MVEVDNIDTLGNLAKINGIAPMLLLDVVD